MTEFIMPSLGADMESAIVYDWRVQPGGRFKRGDVIVSVETDKGVIDVEVFEDGLMEQILVQPGTRVPVGAVLALIRSEGESATPIVETAAAARVQVESHPPAQRPVVRPQAVQPAPGLNGGRLRVSPAARKRAAELQVDLGTVKGTGPDGAISLADVEQAAVSMPFAPTPPIPLVPAEGRIRGSPVARRMAEELGIDLNQVRGTGPQGSIRRADVERAATDLIRQARQPVLPSPIEPPSSPIAPPPSHIVSVPVETVEYQAGMRRAIAKAMARANRDIPHYYLETRIDMSRALRWLEAENLKRPIKERILPAVLLIKTVAKALGDVPELNGYWVDDQLQVQVAIHVGFAIALRQGGLVTPAIHHADLKNLDEVMAALRNLITRTRSGRLRSSELTDATITVTNLGDIGAEKVFGVIYPPQVALVGFGKVADQVWVERGMIGVRPLVIATLAGDHRASDGRRGGQFLDALNQYLQEPEAL